MEPFRGSFVGRAFELHAIEQRLSNRDARLITLLGPGGVGKTRLLHRLAATFSAAAPSSHDFESVIVCDLSTAHSGDDVISRVAAALSGIALAAGTTTTDAAIARVGRALAKTRRCLLALDNLEQLDPAALSVLSQWLGHAKDNNLTILTTSRVRLGLAGEIVHRVGPLSLEESMRVFEDRALAVRAPFDADERKAAERIVSLLEGMPLALEMAATKLCVLGPEDLLSRLSRPLVVLRGTPTDPDRHASMSRVLDGSWELLTNDERHVLAQLAVFHGGFTVDAVEAIVGGDDNVIAILQRLVDSSLLRPAPSRSPARYRHALYEVVREYALERAEDKEVTATKFARHFASWGEARISPMGARDPAALDELVDEEANLAAAERAATSVQGGDRLRILSALEPVRLLGGFGPIDRWVAQLEEALAAPGIEPRITARAALALARGLHELGRTDLARRAYERAIADGALAREPTLESVALSQLGRLSAGEGRWDEANNLFERARMLPGAGDASAKLANACFQFYGAESGVATDIALGIGAYVDLCRRSGSDPRELVFWLVQLGRSESELFRSADDAMKHLDEGLTLARKLGDLRGEGFALFGIGTHQLGWGQPEESVATLTQAARLLREAGTRRFEAWALGFLGVAHAVRDQWEPALAALDPAIEILADVRDAPREAHCLAFRGAVRARMRMNNNDEEARALADLARASKLAPEASRYHGWTIQLCHAQIDVLHAREEPAEREEHLDVARALLRRAGWRSSPKNEPHRDDWPWGGEFYEPRLAAEMLARAIANAEADGGLLVARDGSSFALPSGERASCEGREKLQRILVLLTQTRIEHPGQPIAPAALVECAWGDERMKATAASNRLHVALDSLRKLGLRGIIVRGEGGWLLDPKVSCAWQQVVPLPPPSKE